MAVTDHCITINLYIYIHTHMHVCMDVWMHGCIHTCNPCAVPLSSRRSSRVAACPVLPALGKERCARGWCPAGRESIERKIMDL